MAQSVLSIYNAAISAAGGKGRLTSLDQNTKEKTECDVWYELVRDTVQEAAYWPAVKTVERLNLFAERSSGNWDLSQPVGAYQYAYYLPNNMLRPWHLHDFTPFELIYNQSSDRTLLHTNSKLAVLTYARRNTNPSQWQNSMTQAVIFALAAHITAGISGKVGLLDRNLSTANEFLQRAQSTAAAQNTIKLDVMPPTLAARGGSTSGEPTHYLYPHGDLFSQGSVVNGG